MTDWQPITETDFNNLLEEQFAGLNANDRSLFDQYRVSPWKAIIFRSNNMGDETVFVVAETSFGVIYFDDVEWGFNLSPVDELGKILRPGGSQMDLRDAIRHWLERC